MTGDSPTTPAAARPQRLLEWAGPLTLVVTGLALFLWTWKAWPDLLVDFGRELYTAWQLSDGAILYKDIAYFSGPLSPYLNSLWFRAFGASILTLVGLNLLLLASLTALIYRLLAAVSDRLSASAACLVFLTVFAFAQLAGPTNYNFLTPYSHELTHGLLLAFVGIAGVAVYAHRRHSAGFALAGLGLGLVFLTKVEVFLAAALAIVAGVVLSMWVERPSPSRTVRLIITFLIALVLPTAAAYLLLRTALPHESVWQGLSLQWTALLNEEIRELRFYRWSLGTDDTLRNLGRMILWLGGYTIVLLPAAIFALLTRNRARQRPIVALRLFALTVVVLAVAASGSEWLDLGRPLPFLLVLFVVWTAIRLVRVRDQETDAAGTVLRLSLLLFALGLCAKMLLNARIYHYGFALALPGLLMLVVALLNWIPATIERRGGFGAAFRGVAAAVLTVVVVAALGATAGQLEIKRVKVGHGADLIRSDTTRGPVVAEFLAASADVIREGQTLVVLPEGVMLNYLLRRVNPSPYINFMPVELILFGEARILDAFRASPPDFVALVHKDTSEYGLPFFGEDYGQAILDWVMENYEPVARFGEQPLIAGTRFGIDLLQQRKL